MTFESASIADSLLLTDFYQLNMLQAYTDHAMREEAVFEFFVRKLPGGRGFLMAAGLEQAVAFLESACFSSHELEWLAKSGRFRPELIETLAQWRFTGDVDAMPEGTIFFPDEPILRVVAPQPAAQQFQNPHKKIQQIQKHNRRRLQGGEVRVGGEGPHLSRFRPAPGARSRGGAIRGTGELSGGFRCNRNDIGRAAL
jgi:nicotinate phosphoribosyltransferase